MVAPRTAQIQGAAAASEVTLCFMALLAIPQLGIRGAGTAFVLWNQLRLRYHTPAVMYYHRQARSRGGFGLEEGGCVLHLLPWWPHPPHKQELPGRGPV